MERALVSPSPLEARARWNPAACEGSPLLWAVRERARVFADRTEWPPVQSYEALLGDSGAIRFELPHSRPRRRARRTGASLPSYDARICAGGAVPTRPENWHDFMNALVWSAFPRSKRALHARQWATAEAARAAAAEPPGRRTREQDALAMLDEGGVVLLCADDDRDAAEHALEGRRHDALAALTREGRALGIIYGHAVYEHLACGGPPVRALAAILPCPTLPASPCECLELADAGLAELIASPDPSRDRRLCAPCR